MSDLKKKSAKKIINNKNRNKSDASKKTKAEEETNKRSQMRLSVGQTIADSTPNLKDSCMCSDCENMARNFLYLQSLISRNCFPNKRCDVCSSALDYLQFVNEHLKTIFGSIGSVMEDANTGQSVLNIAGCRILISLELLVNSVPVRANIANEYVMYYANCIEFRVKLRIEPIVLSA
uniref:Uncharacterized protein n=1 Tax=Glossina pallidipes TaxID=7398 RepID=A0A1A9ZHF4_GLOPL